MHCFKNVQLKQLRSLDHLCLHLVRLCIRAEEAQQVSALGMQELLEPISHAGGVRM